MIVSRQFAYIESYVLRLDPELRLRYIDLADHQTQFVLASATGTSKIALGRLRKDSTLRVVIPAQTGLRPEQVVTRWS